MKKICLFSSYSPKNKIDNYVKFYLETLKEHFNEVIIITNKREIIQNDLDFLDIIGVKLKFVKNEGLDFGMWFKALKEIDVNLYDQIGFINDSCILFNKPQFDKIIEWVDKCEYDFCGMTDSNEINHHLQSYFIIAKKNTFNDIINYYKINGIINSDNPWDIIKVYELGLSEHLSKKFKIGSYFQTGKINHNLSIFEAHRLISNGYPMVKKKLLLNSFRDHEYSFLKSHNFNFEFDYRGIIYDKTKNDNLNLDYLLEF